MIVTGDGEPVEVCFRPGSESDLNVLWSMELEIPPHSHLYADGAYNSFDLEDILQESSIELLAKEARKLKNALELERKKER